MRTVVLTRLNCVVITSAAYFAPIGNGWKGVQLKATKMPINYANVLLIELSFYEALEDMEICMPLKCPLESLSILQWHIYVASIYSFPIIW